ncbi:hypothetical protein AAG747_13830 [Rapidithrix thailandica]|uniref:Phage protein n=1 Tax=Rapidithrix thailandica TaxID=413964 RepID=A0AAW9S988_9BACT
MVLQYEIDLDDLTPSQLFERIEELSQKSDYDGLSFEEQEELYGLQAKINDQMDYFEGEYE